MDHPKYFPQHIGKCYCQKKCFCESVEKPEGTHPRFIKLRNETGFIKPQGERIPFSGPNSRCTSRSSYRSTPHQSAYSPSYEFEKSSNTSSDLTMTNKRINYERAKRALAEPTLAHSTHCKDWNLTSRDSPLHYDRQEFCTNIEEDRIKSLSDFRLQNAQDCFSVLSRHSINQRLGRYTKPVEEHVCEFVYRLNSRGLLSPANITEDGRLVCAVCEKVEDTPSPKGIVPMNATEKPHKVILQISDDAPERLGRGKRMCAPVKRNVPANSLALRYQRLT